MNLDNTEKYICAKRSMPNPNITILFISAVSRT